MAVKALVFEKNIDGSYSGISVAKRGQIENGVGEFLYNGFNAKELIIDLLEHGHAVTLSETIQECVFLERDLGEEYDLFEVDDEESFENLICDECPNFVYLFDNVWMFSELDGSGVLEWNDLDDLF